MEALTKETFYDKFKDKFVLDEVKYKFITSAYSVTNKTLRIYKEEVQNHDVLYYQLIHYKTKEVINPDYIYKIFTVDIPKSDGEVFIDISNENVFSMFITDTSIQIPVEKTINVLKPNYYKSKSGQDVLDVIADFDMDFLMGNTFKYIVRAGKKDSATVLEDLNKAKEYIDRKIKMLEK